MATASMANKSWADMVPSREINLLKDEDRTVRKSALQAIKELTAVKHQHTKTDDFQDLVVTHLSKPLSCVLSDPAECCREMAVEILRFYVNNMPKPVELLPCLVPVFVTRLGCHELVELSEELRLGELQILNAMISRSAGDQEVAYMDDLIVILRRTILDPFSEVKKESCSCVMHLAAATPNTFHLQSHSLLNPLLQILPHQHAKVRCMVVLAIGSVIRYGNSKSVSEVSPHLAQRLFDHQPAVRKAVAEVVGQWLTELPDRYSYFTKLLPLLLTCVAEDIEECREKAMELWKLVGENFIEENEEHVKDQIDFPKPPPDHYPPGVTRPSFGCRYLVQRHLYYILPAVLNDLQDWLIETRLKAAGLLYQLLLHSEEKSSSQLGKVLTALSKTATDEEKKVVAITEHCSELLGYFVRPDVWCELFLPIVRANPSAGNLFVLAGMLRRSNKVEMTDYVLRVADILAEQEVCRTARVLNQTYLISCVDALLKTCGDLCKSSSLKLFIVLVTVLSLAESDTDVRNKALLFLLQASQSLQTLSSTVSVKTLYKKHLRKILEDLYPEHELWENLSPETAIFSYLLLNGGAHVGECLDLIIPIFVHNLQPSKPPELQFKFFTLLSTMLVRSKESFNSSGELENYLPDILSDILIPNLTWHAGETASALRATAISCMWMLVKGFPLTNNVLAPFSTQLFARLNSLLEDDSQLTRVHACQVLCKLLPVLGQSVDPTKMYSFHTTLLKRMDDISDEVRVLITKVFSAYFAGFPSGFNVDSYKSQLETVYNGLLLHMGDTQPEVSKAVFKLLKEISHLHPELLTLVVESARAQHGSQEYCDELIHYIQSLQIKSAETI